MKLTGAFFTLLFLSMSLLSNSVPTDILIDNSSIDENESIGSLVGNFSTTDLDGGDIHSYSLIAGVGDDDNSLFQIVGDQLQSNSTFNYESGQISFNIRVETNDGNGGLYEESFVIVLNDINENPVVNSATFNISENLANSTFVGNVTSSDIDGDDVSYSIIGGNTSSAFAINSTTGDITINNSNAVDFETNPVFSLTVQATDDGVGSLTDTEIITVNLSNVNDAPEISIPIAQNVYENQELTINGISILDQDIAANDIYVDLSVSNGRIDLSTVAGLTFTLGDGVDDLSMSFYGNITDVNNSLSGITYTSIDDYVGVENLNIDVNDNGATGPGGILSDSRSLLINVNPIPVVVTTQPQAQILCDEEEVLFYVEHNADATPSVSYQWQFNGVNIGGETNDTLILTGLSSINQGNYRCAITNGAGVTNSSNAYLTMRRKPVASFDYTQVCFGDETEFTSTSMVSTGSITDYNWDLGDANNSSDQDPIHEYLSSGTFNVELIVESNFGCLDTLDSIIQVYHVPVLDVAISNVCFESPFITENNTSIAGGSLNHFWNFDDGETSTDLSPNYLFQSTGTYNITYNVVSDNGCSVNTGGTITVHPKPIANFVVYDACDSTNIPINGVASISSGTINYYWDFGDGSGANGVMNPVHLYLGDSTYNIELMVESDKGCWDTLVKPLTVYPRPDLLLTVAQPVCYGQIGTMMVNGANSTDPYFYSIDGGNYGATNIWSGIPGETYILQVKDFNGCIRQDSVTIDDPQPVSIVLDELSNPTCYGLDNGFVDFHADGGNGGFSYSLYINAYADSNFVSSSQYSEFQGLQGSTYVIRVVDSTFCSSNQSIIVNQPDSIALNVLPNHILCFGDNTGEIEVSATGGTGSFEYSINGGQSFSADNYFDGLTSDFYLISVRDINQCARSIGVDLQEPEQSVELFVTNSTDVNCYGGNDGLIEVVSTGGTGLFEYSLDNMIYQSSEEFEGLISGTYRVYTIDQNNCMDSIDVFLDEPNAPLSIDQVEIIDPLCNGDENASIELTVIGGTPNYLYRFNNEPWNSNNQTNSIEGGWNTYAIKDDNECLLVDSVFVEEPALLVLNIDELIDEVCEEDFTGSLSLSANGGTSPYEFHFNGDVNTTGEFVGITSGDYTVSVQDENGCSTEDYIEFIPEFNLPVASFDFYNAGGAVNFINESEESTDALWSFGDGTNSSEISPFHFYETHGAYDISLVMTNACGTDTAEQIFLYGVNGIDDFTDEISVSYIDHSNSIMINSNNEEISNYYLVDLSGKLIQSGSPNKNNHQLYLTSTESSGLYVLYLQCGKRNYAIKIASID